MTAAFRRNAPLFTAHLSSLLTRTITDHPLVCRFRSNGSQARVHFRDGDETDFISLANGCDIAIIQRIGPHPELENKVTTLQYLYAVRIGSDLAREPLVRYEYVPEEAARPDYPYPRGHAHFGGEAPGYRDMINQFEHKPLHQIHFPTGRITLEEFIELLIIEFHAVTRMNKGDAIALLRSGRGVFLDQKKTKD